MSAFAQSGTLDVLNQCPLLGVEETPAKKLININALVISDRAGATNGATWREFRGVKDFGTLLAATSARKYEFVTSKLQQKHALQGMLPMFISLTAMTENTDVQK